MVQDLTLTSKDARQDAPGSKLAQHNRDNDQRRS
jgi:hypothetical protein